MISGLSFVGKKGEGFAVDGHSDEGELSVERGKIHAVTHISATVIAACRIRFP